MSDKPVDPNDLETLADLMRIAESLDLVKRGGHTDPKSVIADAYYMAGPQGRQGALESLTESIRSSISSGRKDIRERL